MWFTQSWYVAAYSRQLRSGQVKSFDLLNRRIALYRDEDGQLHALDAVCRHLGADLGEGSVIDDQVQCPFHHWRYGPDGACRHAPGLADTPQRRLRTYPTEERWGIIWLFNGPQPAFALPDPPAESHCRALRLPAQHIRCHPHLVIGNGLDVHHFGALHNFDHTSPPTHSVQAPDRVEVRMQGQPRSPWLRRLAGSRQQAIHASFATIGSSLAWVEVERPFPFYVLFAGRPSVQGGCDTQVVFLFPKGTGLRRLQAVFLMYILLYDDHRILDTLHFRPGFTEADTVLKEYAQVVNSMQIW